MPTHHRTIKLHLAIGVQHSVRKSRNLVCNLAVLSPDESLHRLECACGIHHSLTLRNLPNQEFSILREGDCAGRGPLALGIGHHLWHPGLHSRHYGVRGAEVDANYLLPGVHDHCGPLATLATL
mmetsp:Transcript_67510/g.151627  ORF Transcript_67510/g.151627 Transcript_67510/m.151627 type:complete len:124 (-) Transcript_67510:8-379(-)